MAEIKLKGITRRWNDFVGVDNLNLDIPDREFLVLLGPSGCGKSTTMRMIAGLEDVTEGEIWLGDRMVNKLEPKDRDISMVFQSYGLYPTMSVYENIRFPLRIRKVPKAEHKARVMKAAEMVELTQFLDRRPAALSGGQRQRVALARAIVRAPNAFLMDEPLSNLDAKLRVSTRAQIANLHHELKTTTVYVTHDQVEAMTLADRVVVMRHGIAQQIAPPMEIYNKPANTFVAGFIGAPAMNLIEGEMSGGTFRSPVLTVEGLAHRHSGPATLGFRAEDVEVVSEGGNLAAPVYSVERLGDSTMFAIRAREDLISLKADKSASLEIGETVRAKVTPEVSHIFDGTTGQRIEPALTAA
ncbi:ABC transporter ATP-binding protein [Pelagovum pacificum]|uniref:sn-glycerol-3-phosphate ABC transporter ATP-binding protein UgpC n=1 Tax=Pelagovum pacificum TaxID=2588711 RepID=A0A5C5GG10_9RHOB|nr:sn-glycerol-3-phosphate ABC transporter ATP-binding protein UgpC [Pelagovum pacificum]QQA43882.1 sn-glycerol-3-phosphate ABC transporter ATP-binding protein UgpC [Pelagovum pacificum]TNY32987.1 sn-glycerol-3-phosphate ABC transporter ATP-binding protein UgpC [Pelagovum pacificum]